MANTQKTGVYPCYENQFSIGDKKDGASSIADAESFSVSFDNGVEEWNPFDTEGWIRRLLTSKGITISVSAKRNVGDPGNDYVAGKTFLNGRDAEGYFAWNFPDGTIVAFEQAVINVTNIGAGDATAVAPLEFDILSNGKPTITQPAASGSSSASSTSSK